MLELLLKIIKATKVIRIMFQQHRYNNKLVRDSKRVQLQTLL
jgi:hypothetical protein